ncbi:MULTISPECIES: iron ABC transporter substrate-binding protein [unclassified Aureimonas]|uniref:iron ABC transporter substrate-binding protein n=1 Tax=unclassified Aureimonas TaxID=2615206 RepID=UPI0006F78591|nr:MULTISPECIES: iron ABC transporter substrate-binding protein [unclassified Aureimonas]KQT60716.1 iron ABC transporter substrate-binding protein [Aureimonas sp. Leaf460]KQT68845.1 iron ABC transporter substrate-binding protein [Aureimonas sp. Leaf427]
MRNRFVPHVFTAALAVGAALTAFGARAEESGAGITVYNAQHESLTKAWAEGFTKDTGIPVTLRKGSDSEFGNQLVQEGAASPADVFVTENSPAMALVDKAGLFAPLGQETLAEVPAEFRPADGHWVGVAARSTVFAYDKNRLTEADLPKSIADLADPAWKDRWAASPAGADFQAIVAAMLELKGEAATLDWLKAMKTNAKAYKGNSVAMKAVNAGEIEGAVIYHYYWFGDQAKTGENSRNVSLHYFRNQDPGAFVSISGAGVLASSQKKADAEAFVKWIAGPKGQEILKTGTSFEYAVGNGAESNPALTPLTALQAPKVVPDKLDNAKVIELMTTAGIL